MRLYLPRSQIFYPQPFFQLVFIYSTVTPTTFTTATSKIILTANYFKATYLKQIIL